MRPERSAMTTQPEPTNESTTPSTAPVPPPVENPATPTDAVPPPPPPPAETPAPPTDTVPPPPPAAYPAAAPYVQDVARFPNGKPMLDAEGRPASPKSRLAAALLAWFLGWLGIHRFYVGKVGTGILMILTLGGFGIWALIDFIVILVGSFKDKEDRYLANW